ncbi:MAG: amino acid ABC transporter permease [Blautia sp.]|nr:amino acid ABC transporter permease [Blautia sp.]
MTPVSEVISSLNGGILVNLKLFFITLIFSLPLGIIIMFGSRARFTPLRWVTRTFVWIIRGTPLMLQLFVVLYAPGLLLGLPMSNRFLAAEIAFIINYATYFSEIYRGGLESVPKGQHEAAEVLGMTKPQIFFRVILMQVIKRITPAMGNELITLTKDTSLSRVIGLTEIIMCAERFTKKGLILPLFSTGLYFLAMNGILTILLGRLEKKLDYFKV